jgi:DNA-binding CsgD family transcriptional regulator
LEAVSRLSANDAERLLRFVNEAEAVGGDHAFTEDLLVELGRLIEADWVTYHETDFVGRRILGYVPRPGDEDDDDLAMTDEDWELIHEHPVCSQWRALGRDVPLRISDVTTRAALHASRYYGLYLRPWGVEHELKSRFGSPPWHSKTIAFCRKAGADFTVRDRLVLELLTPHLARLWQAARTRGLLAAALAHIESGSETDAHGVVFLGPGGEPEFASASARRLLDTYFPKPNGTRLPVHVARWLEQGGRDPLETRRGERVLAIERSNGSLLLREEEAHVELTRREQEILGWVARGKTNAEIAQFLWIAPSTVRKHLENIYTKLGVGTRTAAVTRFLRLLDAETA